MRDEVDIEVKRREDVERRLSEALPCSTDDAAALQERPKAEQGTARRRGVRKEVRTRPAREDSDQLVDALGRSTTPRTSWPALLAGEALQRQCDASQNRSNATLICRAGRSIKSNSVARERPLLSKSSATSPRRLCQTVEETGAAPALLDAEGRCDALIAEKDDEARRRRDVDGEAEPSRRSSGARRSKVN